MPDADDILQAFLSDSPERSARKPSGTMTRKAQEDTMRAIGRKDLPALSSLIAHPAFTPNFLCSRGGFHRTPLEMATSEGWEPGALALLEAGASDADPAVLSRWSDAHNPLRPALAQAASDSVPIALFEALLRAPSEAPFREQALKIALERSPERVLSAIGILGAQAFFSAGLDPLGESSGLLRSLARSKPDSGPGAAESALASFVLASPPSAGKRADALWREALRADALQLARALAQSGAAPSPGAFRLDAKEIGWSSGLSRDDLIGLPMPAKARWRRKPGGHPWENVQPDASLSADPIAFCAWMGSERCLGALAASPSMLAKSLANPDSLRLLSACSHRGALRALKAAGADMASLSDPDDGLNPLHRALAVTSSSKTAVREIASICPEWSQSPSLDGKYPSDLCSDREILAALESVAARRILPKPSRAKSAARPRRSM